MKFVKRKACTSQKLPPADREPKFLERISATVKANNISSHLVFNWDQTALLLLPTGEWAMEQEGFRRVVVEGLGDKRQITGVLFNYGG